MCRLQSTGWTGSSLKAPTARTNSWRDQLRPLPRAVGVVPPRLLVQSKVGDTPECGGGTHQMYEVHYSHVVRRVTVRAAVDAPVLAA